ncbi:hypothetical protein RIF29_38946 [Crotalaria pallida]|uniref:Uncharacterized protein n=1 Tax=Crotalaria pallida TaxID=3830 RepID=A0AAN9HSV0_CROPI
MLSLVFGQCPFFVISIFLSLLLCFFSFSLLCFPRALIHSLSLSLSLFPFPSKLSLLRSLFFSVCPLAPASGK